MVNFNDIMETITMIQDENLDIRTITMGISLLDCADSDIGNSCRKVYEKICRKAENRPMRVMGATLRDPYVFLTAALADPRITAFSATHIVFGSRPQLFQTEPVPPRMFLSPGSTAAAVIPYSHSC